VTFDPGHLLAPLPPSRASSGCPAQAPDARPARRPATGRASGQANRKGAGDGPPPHGPCVRPCTAASCTTRRTPGVIVDDRDRPWCPRHYALIFAAPDALDAFLCAAIRVLTRAGRALPLAA